MTLETREQKTLRELEWPLVLERIARFCRSEIAAQVLLEWRPEATLAAAQERMRRTREALALRAAGAPLPVMRVEDQAEAWATLTRGASLEGREIYTLSLTLEAAEQLRGYLERHADNAPVLRQWLRTSPALAGLLAQIQRAVAPDGSLHDTASSALEHARRKSRDLRADLRQRVSGLLGRFAEAVQGQYLVERDGRYVLPVRADAPFRIDGLVLGSSASGGTLYVEPALTHELGNELQRAEARVRAEEARVFTELNAAVLHELEDVRAAQTACIEADCLNALVEFADAERALAFEPDGIARLELKAMRHPLLSAAAEVVANDLSIEGGQALILSGPNAGGKTVALKCLGLAAWMVRTGIPIPANAGSRVGWFDPVMTDIGDNQSLMQSLSTFSAHMQHVAEGIAAARAGALILIDELAGGTDPDEGAALACAVVERLLDRGAAVCVTTHYERLKTRAAEDTRLKNASVGFDREHLRPTFRIVHGVPGPSSALLIAERHGVAHDVIERARALVPDAQRTGQRLLDELEQERARLEHSQRELEREKAAVHTLRQDLEREQTRMKSQERERLSAETRELLDEVRRARGSLREAEARLKTAPLDRRLLAGAEQALNQAAEFVAIGGKLRRAAQALESRVEPEATPLGWDALAVGMPVRFGPLGAEGKIVDKPKRDKLIVLVGSMKATVDVSEVTLLSRTAGAESAPTRAPRQKPQPRAALAQGLSLARVDANTCDLRGMRVDEAIDRLDAFIDRLLRSGEPAGFVLHGHGTGALKAAVREHLRVAPHVARSEPAESGDGGDAFTVLWLR